MIRVMARSSRYPRFRDYLETCARRLDGLASLADAATRYQMQFGQPPQALNDLVTSHIIAAIPQDPFGFGYGLDGKGNPILFERPQR